MISKDIRISTYQMKLLLNIWKRKQAIKSHEKNFSKQQFVIEMKKKIKYEERE